MLSLQLVVISVWLTSNQHGGISWEKFLDYYGFPIDKHTHIPVLERQYILPFA